MEGATSLNASTLEAPELVACFSSTSSLRLPFSPSLYGHSSIIRCRCRHRAILDDPVLYTSNKTIGMEEENKNENGRNLSLLPPRR
ncbi:hypothetical protein V6N13_121921 [Hibiscus sabdariffa]|uniref:Uncharacterized protein n=1 Tax=Hibiscus sabdariffa TaxID=183260 RepID=A0ABR2C6R7_9ROSI